MSKPPNRSTVAVNAASTASRSLTSSRHADAAHRFGDLVRAGRVNVTHRHLRPRCG